MIKLIVSDVDGTLIFDETKINVLNPRALELIAECKKRGITFAVASGRSYANLKKVFLPQWENLYFLSDNGNIMYYNNKLLRELPIPQPLVREIIDYLIDHPTMGVSFTTAEKMLLFEEPKWFSDLCIYDMKNAVILIDDIQEIYAEKIINISTFVPEDQAEEQDRDFNERWGDLLQITRSGSGWVEFALSGKGAGVRDIMERHGYTKDEVMVFGDNYNDIEMLSSVTHSFAMAGADDEVKAHAKYVTPSVEDVIERFLNTGEIG